MIATPFQNATPGILNLVIQDESLSHP